MTQKGLRIGLMALYCTVPSCFGALTPASTCATATLAAYQSLGPGGCTLLNGGNTYIFKNFDFAVPSSSGTDPINAGQISVTPLSGPDMLGLNFASPGFNVTGNEAVQYLISFYVDPLPPDIWRVETEMLAESPVAPGFAAITTDVCVGSNFISGTCPTTVASGTVFHAGSQGQQLLTRIDFTPTNNVGIRNLITLDANGAVSQIDGFQNRVVLLPEPGTWMMMAGGLGLVALRIRQRRRTG
jgi:hypothetical protein